MKHCPNEQRDQSARDASVRAQRRCAGRPLGTHLALATFAALALGSPGEVLAYRPFGSTDADVAAADEIELELGYLTIERDPGETAYITPSVVLEFVGDLNLQERGGEFGEISDPKSQIVYNVLLLLQFRNMKPPE